MFEIIITEGDRFRIDFNNKVRTGTIWNDKIIIEDITGAEFKKINKLKAKDFPNNLYICYESKKKYLKSFDSFSVYRKGSSIIINVAGSFEQNNNELDWLLWNPQTFADKLHNLALANGFKIGKYSFRANGNQNIVRLIFTYKLKEETIGAFFTASLKETENLMEETNNYFGLLYKKTFRSSKVFLKGDPAH